MMPTAYEEATALAQQYVADRMGAMQARIDELETARQGAGYGALPPAVPASGAHYSAPGAYEGYADYGFDPVMYQRSPYATATTRVFAGPNGQLGVQPQIGFASAYPHVIQYPGDNPLRALPLLDAFVGSMWRNLPPPTIVPMRGGMGVGGGAPRGSNTQSKNPPTTDLMKAPPAPMKLVPPEVRYAGNGYAVPIRQAASVAGGSPVSAPAGVEIWPDYEGDMWSDLEAPVYPVPDRDWALLSQEGTRIIPQNVVPPQGGAAPLAPQQSIPLPQLAASHVSAPGLMPAHNTSLGDLVNSSQQAVLQAAGYR